MTLTSKENISLSPRPYERLVQNTHLFREFGHVAVLSFEVPSVLKEFFFFFPLMENINMFLFFLIYSSFNWFSLTVKRFDLNVIGSDSFCRVFHIYIHMHRGGKSCRGGRMF